MSDNTKYNLDTISGVLRALADGHTLVSGSYAIRVSGDGKRVELSLSGHPGVATWNAVIESGSRKPSWQLAPKDVENMTASELARELWGKDARVGKSSLPHDNARWVHDSLVHINMLHARSEAELLSMLRVLVKAKRAGEL